MIYIADSTFNSIKLNPYDRNNPYTDKWILLRLIHDDSFFQCTRGGMDEVFQLILTKKTDDWRYRVMDFIQYETKVGKNMIISINSNDFFEAESVYDNHTYKDRTLRDYERPILVHSTTQENYRAICNSGFLKSWNRLKSEGAIKEEKPIGSLLGDPEDYRDYIMFGNGGYFCEIVTSSRQKGYIEMNPDAEYVAGARMYFDAAKIAADGQLIRDGAHMKVKDILSLEYLLWVATPSCLSVSERTTPRTFARLADSAFEEKINVRL